MAAYFAWKLQWQARVSRVGEAVRAFPIFIEQVPVAKIGNPGAADFAKSGKRGRIRA